MAVLAIAIKKPIPPVPPGPEDQEKIFDVDNIYNNSIVLTEADTVAQCTTTSGGHGVATKRGRKSGKYYFEFKYVTLPGSKQVLVGFLEFPFVWTSGHFFRAWDRRVGTATSATPTDAAVTYANDVIGVALDLDNHKAFFALNDNWMSYSGQDSNPVTGVDPLRTLVADTYYYPTVYWYYNNSTIEYRKYGSYYAPPDGYTYW